MTKVRDGEDIFVFRDEGENWEEKDIPVVIIDSMSNPLGGGHGLCLDCASILCHYTGCDIALKCGEMHSLHIGSLWYTFLLLQVNFSPVNILKLNIKMNMVPFGDL